MFGSVASELIAFPQETCISNLDYPKD